MITKNTITPWYQPQLQSFRINYIENDFGFTHAGQDHQNNEGGIRKKAHSFNTLDQKTQKAIERPIALRQFKTLDYREQHKTKVFQTKAHKQPRNKILLNDRKNWFRRNISFETISDEQVIFRPKGELSSEKISIRLPKIEIRMKK